MRFIATIFLLSIIIIFAAFQYFKKPDYVDYAHEIIRKVSNCLANRHGITQVGVGGGFLKQINNLFIMYRCDRPLNKDQARALIIDCSEELLQAINQHEQIRPFLSHYPFDHEDVAITIMLCDEKGNRLYFPEVGVVKLSCGNICFCVQVPNKIGYETEEIEPYLEALECVRRQEAQKENE